MSALRLTICFGLLFISNFPVSANTATVAEVHPGCVLELDGGWQTRILGIQVDGLETDSGRSALAFCRDKLEGRLIKLFTWTRDDTAKGIVFGSDGLAFARVFFGNELNTDLAEELLRRRLARVDADRLPPEIEHYVEIVDDAGNSGLE